MGGWGRGEFLFSSETQRGFYLPLKKFSKVLCRGVVGCVVGGGERGGWGKDLVGRGGGGGGGEGRGGQRGIVGSRAGEKKRNERNHK